MSQNDLDTCKCLRPSQNAGRLVACRGYEVVEEGLAVLEVAGQQGQEDLFLQLQWVDPSRPILWRREVIEHFFPS